MLASSAFKVAALIVVDYDNKSKESHNIHNNIRFFFNFPKELYGLLDRTARKKDDGIKFSDGKLLSDYEISENYHLDKILDSMGECCYS